MGLGAGFNYGTFKGYEKLSPARRERINDAFWNGTGFNALRLWLNMKCYAPTSEKVDFDAGFVRPYLDLVRAAEARGVTEILLTVDGAPADLMERREVVLPHTGKPKEMPTIKVETTAKRAELIADYIQEVRDRYGITIDAVSIQNEPNTPHVLYLNHIDMTQSVLDLRAALDARGLTDTIVVGPETASADRVAFKMLEHLRNTPGAWDALGGISTHSYNMAAHPRAYHFTDGGTKTYWQGESSVPSKEKPGDVRAATITAARFLNDMNHGVTHWFHFIGFMHQGSRKDDGTRIIPFVPEVRDDAWMWKLTKYWYFQQLTATFDYGAVFRQPISSLDKTMLWTHGRKPRVTLAAARNPDGTWGVALTNFTHPPLPDSAKKFSRQNAGRPTQSFDVTVEIAELADVPEMVFDVRRSGPQPNGGVVQNRPEGSTTAKDGRLRLTINPMELVTLRSRP